ncbi:MAG: monofunctional biosynthetic peptidoglycan transglycosylase [Prevotellaceae bacterium]|jgi:monofunctional biosynthetic peptidoglycan transglycosylase|nr:monofunctional biosynthetic peptidoglycan transglycosylase [Prevotellaceae bacterium]
MKKKSSIWKKAVKIVIRLFLIFVIASLASVFILIWLPVKHTPLMCQRYFENIDDDSYYAHSEWKPIEEINREMVLAVLASEDAKFIRHCGFDWEAIKKAAEHNKRSDRKFGASTISQQTAKNVFLLPSRTWFRKGLEAWFTILIELMWSKERIMEVYLNVIETGNGMYGVEAASQYYFGKPASKLNRYEAAQIASILPNPQGWDLNRPSRQLLRRQSKILAEMSRLSLPPEIKAAR